MIEQAVLKVKKIIHQGEPCFEVVGFTGVLNKEQLPKEYLAQGPFFYKSDLTCSSRPFIKMCSIGDVTIGEKIPQDKFDKIIKYMKECGTRLGQINKKIKEIEPKWNGQEIEIKI